MEQEENDVAEQKGKRNRITMVVRMCEAAKGKRQKSAYHSR